MVLLLFIVQVLLLLLGEAPRVVSENQLKCPHGFMGEDCDLVCEGGKYGDGCKSDCGCQNGAYCSHIDGECDCKHLQGVNGTKGDLLLGWEGLLCDRPCRKGFFSHACRVECPCDAGQGECNPQTGECECLPGFTGRECDLQCNFFKYGLNCSKTCDRSERSSGCDHVTGKGHCKPGFHGWICNSTCRDGFWGKTCNATCECGSATTPCHQQTGECHCPPGHKMDKSLRCSDTCPNGTYGYGCEESCLTWNRPFEGVYLAPEQTCDPVTGDRICSPGYTGLNCWNSCPSGKFGLKCSADCRCANGDCHHVTGDCRCNKGWTGKTCLEMCPEGTYGFNCSLQCIACQNGGYCVHRHECICPNGWGGADCSVKSFSLAGDLEKSYLRISLTLAVLLLAITLLMMFFVCRITRSDRNRNYDLTHLETSQAPVTRVESQDDHLFDGMYRNMVRVESLHDLHQSNEKLI